MLMVNQSVLVMVNGQDVIVQVSNKEKDVMVNGQDVIVQVSEY